MRSALDDTVEAQFIQAHLTSEEFIKPQPSSKAPADWFTGDVWWDVIGAGQEPSRMRANLVRFSPGARTHWHSHAVGRTLHVVSGIALIGTRDGTVFEAHPGETVACPPDEEHGHGAVPRPVHGAHRPVGGRGQRHSRDHVDCSTALQRAQMPPMTSVSRF